MPDQLTHRHYVGVRFKGSDKSYYFSTSFTDLKPGDLVVVETVAGYEIGTVSTAVKDREVYNSNLALKPILRKPTPQDLEDYAYNLAQEKKALEITKREVEKLGLPMDLIDANYTLDGEKITITFTSIEKRVDFRELLHVLAPLLHCRIELRQIASRDRAKLTGGIGICGLPLCCSTFLTTFEGISITRAKNQMLSMTIPKLSGACGKLICCLAFEDDAYTEAKKEFPHIGTVVRLDGTEYRVDSFNILSRKVRLVNAARDDWRTFDLEDVLAMLNGTYVQPTAPKLVREDDYLSSFNLPDVEEKQNEEQSEKNENKERRFDRHRDHRHGKGHNNNQNQNRPSGQENRPQNQNNGNNNGNPHRHNRNRHRHGKGPRNNENTDK